MARTQSRARAVPVSRRGQSQAKVCSRCHLGDLLRDVGEEAELPSPLDSRGQLVLMTTAAAGHAGGTDLALLRELAADSAEVLVVDDVDLVPAVRAGLAPACAGRSLPITAAAARAAGLLPATRFTCHLLRSPHRFQRKSPRSRDSEECIGRKADRLPEVGGQDESSPPRVEPAFHLRARDQVAR
jgi:hypothetical protein